MKKSRKLFSLKNLALFGLFILLFFVVRFTLLDIRRVQSSSMAPTIGQGEWILVNKLYGQIGEPKQFDIVMFSRPNEPAPYIKRVVGMPGSRISLQKGDLYIDGKILRKSLEQFFAQASIGFDSRKDSMDSYWNYSAALASVRDSQMLLQVPENRTAVSVVRKIDYAHVPANDFLLRIKFQAPEEATFFAIFGEEGDRFQFTLKLTEQAIHGRIERFLPGDQIKPPDTILVEKAGLPLLPGSVHELQVGNIDNRLFFLLDQRPWTPHVDYEHNSPRILVGGPTIEIPGSVSFGLFSGSFFIENFSLYEDIHYSYAGRYSLTDSLILGPQEYFLLGDNSMLSEDSRFFGAIRREQILGQAISVIYPFTHMRKLSN